MREYFETMSLKSGAAMEENMEVISSKKRKLFVELQNEYCGGGVKSTTENSGLVETTGFSGGVVAEKSLGSPDLENTDLNFDGSKTETSMSMNENFREATPRIEGETEQGQMYLSSSTPKKKSRRASQAAISRRELPTEKMPSAAELEEFFAGAEKCEQKRFAEKYNYDIVKDVPLEGKYQWVRLHH